MALVHRRLGDHYLFQSLLIHRTLANFSNRRSERIGAGLKERHANRCAHLRPKALGVQLGERIPSAHGRPFQGIYQSAVRTNYEVTGAQIRSVLPTR